MKKVLQIFLVALIFSSCSNVIVPYYTTVDKITKVNPGMTKDQVTYVMGQPSFENFFETDVWNYFFQIKTGDEIREERRAKIIFDEKSRALLIQTLVIGLFAVFIYLIAQQTSYNLEKRGISTGFDFLNIAAGYDISIRLIPFSSEDTHLRAYFVGLLNTLMIAVCGCILATILGFLVGIIRLSSNWLFRNIAYVYVEFTRNVPVLLQIILYYSILLNLPKIKQAFVIFDTFYLTNRGLFSPSPIFKEGFSIVLWSFIFALIFSILLKRFLKNKQEQTGKQYPIFLINSAIIIFTPILFFYLMGMPLEFDSPVLKGFNFKGGMVIRPEFLGMLFGLSIYTAAFISETVRSGIISVSKGQREASQALGLKSSFVMRLIIKDAILFIV